MIYHLKERKGLSIQAIAKPNNKFGKNVDSQVKINLKRMVVAGELVQVKGTGASGSIRIAAKPKTIKEACCSRQEAQKQLKKSAENKTTPKKKVASTKKVTQKDKAKKSDS